ncbi:hypothetical protein M0R45_027558 [Rubus argutus]|uniref:Cryptochrome C-terminal domain-containing protein n=1 Tax=Rubus argutus TaxID=59490 RepID=A0AAW1X3E0_RUBAR
MASASRAAVENGTEEGLGESSESTVIAFPQDIQMEDSNEQVRNNPSPPARRYEDQMVPSITTSLVRVEEEECSVDLEIWLKKAAGQKCPQMLLGNQDQEEMR